MYRYVYVHLALSPITKGRAAVARAQVGLYTILPSPILYGVWHKKAGAVGGRILRNGRAIVLQYGRLCRGGGQ